jgi:flagellar motor switch protein FliM
MAVNDLLTQEEINALLSGQPNDDLIIGDKEGESRASVGDPEPEEDWGENQQIPALGVLNRRYAQLFKMVFFNLLRKDTSVSVSGVNLLKYSDYLDSLYVPSSVNIVQINPLKGSALFILDPQLVFMIVENYFGGDGAYPTRRRKQEFTPVEQRVIELLLEKIFVVLGKAWEPVMPLEFELVQSVVNSQLTGIDNPDESVVVSSFCVEIPNKNGLSQKGELQISMPYSLLEDILGADVQE